jgi:hypothetical protein
MRFLVVFVALVVGEALAAVVNLASSTVEVDGIPYYVPGTVVV